MQATSTVDNTPFTLMEMQIDHTAAAGVPLTASADNKSGVSAVDGTTTCTEYVGLLTTAVTYATAHVTSNADVQAAAQVVVNPNLVIRSRLSGTAAAGGAMAVITATAASSDGLDCGGVGTDRYTVWGYSGANVGHFRVQDAANQVVVSWPYLNAIGDEWLEAAAVAHMGDLGVVLCTELTECHAAGSINTTRNFSTYLVEGRAASKEGRTKSFVHIVPNDAFYKTV